MERRKEFLVRNSLLTDLFQHVNHIKTIYNMCVAMLLIFISKTILSAAWNGSGTEHFNNLLVGCGRLRVTMTIWICMFLSLTHIFFPLFKLWMYRKKNVVAKSNLMDHLYLTALIVYVAIFLSLPAKYALYFDIPPLLTFILLIEQVRLIMKLYSFVRENVPYVLTDKSTDKKNAVAYEEPCLSHFIYFFFAPTLLYRNHYPRSQTIRWPRVFLGCFQFIASSILGNFIFTQFGLAEFHKFDKNHVALKSFMVAWFNCIFPGIFCFLIFFFAVLHSWHNIFAEILRFGDRLFYEDWWNAHNFTVFFRKWNIIVHDWLRTYVYQEITYIFGRQSKLLAFMVVFCLSAVVHEYILIISLRFFYPVLFVQFFGVSLPVLLLLDSTKNPLMNIFFWFAMFTGTGLQLCLYALEWYARINCPTPYEGRFIDYFIPRSWHCST